MSMLDKKWPVSSLNVIDGASAIRVALSLVPGWSLLDFYCASSSVVSGGITNAIWCIHITCPVPMGTPTYALVRVFGAGSSVFIDRETDTARVAALASRGLGPLLYGAFTNGRVEQWYENTRPLEPAEMGEPELAAAIARATAALHVGASDMVTTFAAVVVGGDSSSSSGGDGDDGAVLWGRINSWLDVAAAMGGIECSDRVARARASAMWAKNALNTNAAAVRWSEAARARAEAQGESSFIADARAAGAAAALTIVFAHNDLLSGNVLVSSLEDDKKNEARHRDVQLIDTEYAAPNYLGFEIANNWMEICGFEVDLTLFPSPTARRDWTRAYVRAGGAGIAGATVLAAGSDCTDAFADELAISALRFIIASHLWWGSWALVQAGQNNDSTNTTTTTTTTTTQEFDYWGYSQRRLILIEKHIAEFFP